MRWDILLVARKALESSTASGTGLVIAQSAHAAGWDSSLVFRSGAAGLSGWSFGLVFLADLAGLLVI